MGLCMRAFLRARCRAFFAVSYSALLRLRKSQVTQQPLRVKRTLFDPHSSHVAP